MLSALRVLCGLLCWGAVVHAVELDLAPPGAFTIVVIPDSQGYRGARTKRPASGF